MMETYCENKEEIKANTDKKIWRGKESVIPSAAKMFSKVRLKNNDWIINELGKIGESWVYNPDLFNLYVYSFTHSFKTFIQTPSVFWACSTMGSLYGEYMPDEDTQRA